MAPRLDLQALLVETLGSDNVYFQAPPEHKMEYPCIVYERDFRQTVHANGKPYNHKLRYLVTVIDPNPDSDIPDRVADLPTASFDRSFSTDNLHHEVYNLFF